MVKERMLGLINGVVTADPVRLFIKNEPHPARKRETKTWRLIMNVSLVDVIIEKMLFNSQNKAEIKSHAMCYSRPGMGNEDYDYVNMRNMRSVLPGELNASGDVRGFDWSVRAWELRWDARFRCLQAGASPTSWYSRAVMARCEALVGAVLMLSDGRMYMPVLPGIQLSGSNNTSSTNSRIRVLIAFLIGARWALANGDDCVEDPVDDAVAKYKRLGHNLRFYAVTPRAEIDFCSHQYSTGGVVPNNYGKALYRLLSLDIVPEEHLLQFEHYVRHVPGLGPGVRAYVAAIGKLGVIPDKPGKTVKLCHDDEEQENPPSLSANTRLSGKGTLLAC